MEKKAIFVTNVSIRSGKGERERGRNEKKGIFFILNIPLTKMRSRKMEGSRALFGQVPESFAVDKRGVFQPLGGA
jgi:hypothetical protein